jgi:hypothetical protein
VLRLRAENGQVVPVLPLAIWAVIKETPGVLRFQVIQVGPSALDIRLETKEADDQKDVWQAVQQRLQPFLANQGLPNVTNRLSTELPKRDPKSGKFRHIWVELGCPVERF